MEEEIMPPGQVMQYEFVAWFVFFGMTSGMSSKFLAPSIVWTIAFMAVYPSIDAMEFFRIWIIASYIIAGFRGS